MEGRSDNRGEVPAAPPIKHYRMFIIQEFTLVRQGLQALLTRQEPLTEQEHEVLRLSACGYRYREIGRKLGIGARTAEAYKASALAKLGIRSRVELVRYSLAQGWLAEA